MPRRTARPAPTPEAHRWPPPQVDPSAHRAIRAELAGLRIEVPGVRGCVLGGVDGLLITHDLGPDIEPYDLAALAATTCGIGRQVGSRLGQGGFRETTTRNQHGYLSVYAVNGHALLAVVGDDAVNVARLHLYAPAVAARLAALLDGDTDR
ncbi:dynein regulation protein LC7 [Micromonospora echinofusca]|uniref:Dynein regulation protein LC7 n=1 Tax=Micromonospora echinofusca TaxID=47858 RepID=A0ABS3W149_MICEH|nr:dynein regulation protein LC7 [Micromonospora echinofusca]